MQSFGPPRTTTNPYLVQLVRSLPEDVHVRFFSWRPALLGRYQVFHLHWPEVLVRGRSPVRTAARLVLVLALLLRWRLTRVAVVRTLHNARPHEPGGRLERIVLDLIDRVTVLGIHLEVERTPDQPDVHVPHGHYRDWYEHVPQPDTVPGRLAFVGLLRRYKGVPDLLRAFGETAARLPSATLEIAGAATDDELRAELEGMAAADARVRLHVAYLDDEEMARAIGESVVVALPYREMGNSGAALLALSLGRPVLVPRSPRTQALADEVGRAWVLLYEPPVDAEDLVRAVSARPDGAPDLSGRDWPDAGRQHADAYRAAVRCRRAPHPEGRFIDGS